MARAARAENKLNFQWTDKRAHDIFNLAFRLCGAAAHGHVFVVRACWILIPDSVEIWKARVLSLVVVNIAITIRTKNICFHFNGTRWPLATYGQGSSLEMETAARAHNKYKRHEFIVFNGLTSFFSPLIELLFLFRVRSFGWHFNFNYSCLMLMLMSPPFIENLMLHSKRKKQNQNVRDNNNRNMHARMLQTQHTHCRTADALTCTQNAERWTKNKKMVCSFVFIMLFLMSF